MAFLKTLIMVASAVLASCETPPIVFKRVVAYDRIWDDTNSGSSKGITIWRPKAIESGYYALGDAGVPSTNSARPKTTAILVKALEPDALEPPVSFTEIWRDQGSGGKDNGRFLRLEPPSGYTCLGYAAVASWNTLPSLNLFRCVKNKYVETDAGKYQLLWNDRGSGATEEISLYYNFPSGLDTYALDAFTFTAFGNYNTPSGSPPLLNGRLVKNHQEVDFSVSNYSFNVYETPDKDMIWTDQMSGAPKGISIWRSRGKTGTYSLGDIAYPQTKGEPVNGFVVKPLKEDALAAPTSFRQIYKNAGTGAQLNVAFYLPICPGGYRPLGHVATKSHSENPTTDSIRCVKEEYTTLGKWEFIWDDKGSGGNQECTVSEARALNSEGQSVQAMWTVQSYDRNMGATPFVLKSNVVKYMKGKPVLSYNIQNIVYHLDDREIVVNEPESIQKTTLVNKGDSNQKASRTVNYGITEEHSWGHSAGLEIGVATTINAGVPFIANTEISLSSTASFSQEWGSATSKTKDDSIAVDITVQPRSSKIAEIVGNRYTMDVPYTATLITHYADDTDETKSDFHGVFRGVEVNDIKITEIVGTRYTKDLPYTATLIAHYTDGTTGNRGDFEGIGVEDNDIRVIYHEDIQLV